MLFRSQLEGFFAGVLAQFGVQGDVATDESLERRAYLPHDRPLAHGDAPHHAQVPHDRHPLDV